MKYSVALIFGGEGCEHSVSRISAKNLSTLIDRSKYSLIRVFISEKGEWFIEYSGSLSPAFPTMMSGVGGLISEGRFIPIDVAIPALHGDLGEDGVIVGALRTAHIPFIGCDTASSAVCADKILTKSVADALNIPTAKWIFSSEEDPSIAKARAERDIGYPMFIKPALLGSSIGISKVRIAEDFCEAYRRASEKCGRLIIEECISVKAELECAYLGANGCDRYAVGAVLSNGRFYDFDEKYGSDSRTDTTVFGIDEEAELTVKGYAARLRELIGIKGLARLDFFLTDDGKILFNEINTFPGMTPTSLYPLLTEKMGYKKGEFINLLISEALL